MADLPHIERFIEAAHAGQTDKAGKPYHLHPKRVRRILRELFADATEDEEMAALCHDVREDTAATHDDLVRVGLSTGALEIIDAVTRGEDQTYQQFIDSIARHANRGAIRVKIADLTDNSDESRIVGLPAEKQAEIRAMIAQRYKPALELLWATLRDRA